MSRPAPSPPPSSDLLIRAILAIDPKLVQSIVAAVIGLQPIPFDRMIQQVLPGLIPQLLPPGSGEGTHAMLAGMDPKLIHAILPKLPPEVVCGIVMLAAPNYKIMFNSLSTVATGKERETLQRDVVQAMTTIGFGDIVVRAMVMALQKCDNAFEHSELKRFLNTFSTIYVKNNRTGKQAFLSALENTKEYLCSAPANPLARASPLSYEAGKRRTREQLRGDLQRWWNKTLKAKVEEGLNNSSIKSEAQRRYFDLAALFNDMMTYNPQTSKIFLPASICNLIKTYSDPKFVDDGVIQGKSLPSFLIKMLRAEAQNDLHRTQIRFTSFNRLCDFLGELWKELSADSRDHYDFFLKPCFPDNQGYADIKLYVRVKRADGLPLVIELKIVLDEHTEDDHAVYEEMRQSEMLQQFIQSMTDSFAGDEVQTDLAFTVAGNILRGLDRFVKLNERH